MSNINFKIITNLLGLLLIITGVLMLTAVPFSFIDKNGEVFPILISAGLCFLFGIILYRIKKSSQEVALRKRDGYLIVSLGWIIISVFGCLPFYISGSIENFGDAFFETISGFTTTGASILNDIESMPKGLLFWRSMTQWIGGMGIIVMTIAILPILGIGGMELFIAEAPGPTSDKIHPRIKETAKRLWIIYVSLTALLTFLLFLEGMGFYDAINHALTTMATGGFSTKQDSIAFYDSPWIHYTLSIFMILAGTNYTVMYLLVKGKFKILKTQEEFSIYMQTIALFTVFITIFVFWSSNMSFEESFRVSLFQVASIITTTGFVSADYTLWPAFLILVVFIMMFLGGSAGSTSGGIKIVRHYIMAKNCLLEFKRALHPRAVIPVKLNNKVIAPEVISNILVFVLIYLSIFVGSSVVLSALGLDFISSIGAVATSLGNVGPGLGTVGPVNNFAHLPMAAKWFLSFLMLVGRLELYTVLIIFTPYFWKRT